MSNVKLNKYLIIFKVISFIVLSKLNFVLASNYDSSGIWYNNGHTNGELAYQKAINKYLNNSYQLLYFINNTFRRETTKRSMFDIRDQILSGNTKYYLTYRVYPSNSSSIKYDFIRLTKNSVGTQFLKYLDDEPRENTIYFNIMSNRFFKFNRGVEIDCVLHIHDIKFNQVYCFSQIIDNNELYVFKYHLPKENLPLNIYNGDLIRVSGETYPIGTMFSDLDNKGVKLKNVSIQKIQNNVAEYLEWVGTGSSGYEGVRRARSYSKLKNDYSRNKTYMGMTILVKP